jgi:hypothetical protein
MFLEAFVLLPLSPPQIPTLRKITCIIWNLKYGVMIYLFLEYYYFENDRQGTVK